MSNYTQVVDFSAKDGLSPGDPNKKIVGAQVDGELDLIATAIASKEDTANKGAVNGYCPLDASGLVATSDLPTNALLNDQATATITGNWTFEVSALGDVTVDRQSTTEAAAIGYANDDGVKGYIGVDDAGAFTFWNSATTAKFVIDTNGQVTTGSLANAIVSSGNVTQHQASLTILETQITDGSVLARVGGNETITGTWTFSGTPALPTGATVNGVVIGYRNVPRRTSGVAVGECLSTTTGVTITSGAAGDTYSIYNSNTTSITLTQDTGMTLQLAGQNGTTGNRTLAAKGLATVWYDSATTAIVTGSGVS